MFREIRTSDLFEACYYMIEGLELLALEKLTSTFEDQEYFFVFAGKETRIDALCKEFLSEQAEVNLAIFSRVYKELHFKLHLARQNSKLKNLEKRK